MALDRKLGAAEGALVALIWECIIVLVVVIAYQLVKAALR